VINEQIQEIGFVRYWYQPKMSNFTVSRCLAVSKAGSIAYSESYSLPTVLQPCWCQFIICKILTARWLCWRCTCRACCRPRSDTWASCTRPRTSRTPCTTPRVSRLYAETTALQCPRYVTNMWWFLCINLHIVKSLSCGLTTLDMLVDS